jgi:hypothetical protein
LFIGYGRPDILFHVHGKLAAGFPRAEMIAVFGMRETSRPTELYKLQRKSCRSSGSQTWLGTNHVVELYDDIKDRNQNGQN